MDNKTRMRALADSDGRIIKGLRGIIENQRSSIAKLHDKILQQTKTLDLISKKVHAVNTQLTALKDRVLRLQSPDPHGE